MSRSVESAMPMRSSSSLCCCETSACVCASSAAAAARTVTTTAAGSSGETSQPPTCGFAASQAFDEAGSATTIVVARSLCAINASAASTVAWEPSESRRVSSIK